MQIRELRVLLEDQIERFEFAYNQQTRHTIRRWPHGEDLEDAEVSGLLGTRCPCGDNTLRGQERPPYRCHWLCPSAGHSRSKRHWPPHDHEGFFGHQLARTITTVPPSSPRQSSQSIAPSYTEDLH